MASEARAQYGEKRTALFVSVIVFSAVLHGVLMHFLAPQSISTFGDEARRMQRRVRSYPALRVDRAPGDPLSDGDEKARPAAAPVTESDADRVKRLAGGAAPSVPVAEAIREAFPEMRPDVAGGEWSAAPDVLAVETPVVPDESAALPRVFTPIVSGGGTTKPFYAPPPAVSSAIPGGAPGGIGFAVAAPGTDDAVFSVAPDAVPATAGEPSSAKATSAEALAAPSDLPSSVMDEVDERTVEREKEAVRALRDDQDALDLAPHVAVTVETKPVAGRDDVLFFRIRMQHNPTDPLPVVSKDVVVLLDGSGSIGNDRYARCRDTARALLRTLNSGDRFNMVVFRDKFEYLYREWQPVSSVSLATAERWLATETAHGNTDVFASMRSILTLPRTPARPVTALVVTDAEATTGLVDPRTIVERFLALNGGLVNVFMYGVKNTADEMLMDAIARGSRGGWVKHRGVRSRADAELPALAEQYREPVLTDVSFVFTSDVKNVIPTFAANLTRAKAVEMTGYCPSARPHLSFAVRGLNGAKTYEGFYKITLPRHPAKGRKQ